MTGKEIAQVQEGTKEDIDLAVQAAVRAFDRKSEWKQISASQRGLLINRLADLVERDTAYIAVSTRRLSFSLSHTGSLF